MDKTKSKITSTLPYQRMVVKVGTTLLTDRSGHLDQEMMAKLVGQMAELHRLHRQARLQAALIQRLGTGKTLDQASSALDRLWAASGELSDAALAAYARAYKLEAMPEPKTAAVAATTRTQRRKRFNRDEV